MFTTMLFTFSEVRLLYASVVPVTGPAVANMPGSPVSRCSAGERSAGPRPVDRKLEEPSALTVTFAGPEVFTVTLFPLAGFEKVIFAAPVNRKSEDPSVALSSLTNTLSTSCLAWTRNPQFVLSKPGKKSRNCHPPPRPPARAGEAVTTPPNMLSSAPSVTITANRLMAITPTAPPHGGPVPGIASSRATGRGGDSRHRPLYRLLGMPSRAVYVHKDNLNSFAN